MLPPPSGECPCDCHKPGANILHVVACCAPCDDCDLNIALGWESNHKKWHKDKQYFLRD